MAKSKKNRSFREWYEDDQFDYYDDDENLDMRKQKNHSKTLSKQEQVKLERRKKGRDKRNFNL